MMLNTSTMIWGHFFQKKRTLTAVTYAMGNFDILFSMSAAACKRYHMVKIYFLIWLNLLFTDVTPHAVTFKDMLKVYLTRSGLVFERVALLNLLNKFKRVGFNVLLTSLEYYFLIFFPVHSSFYNTLVSVFDVTLLVYRENFLMICCFICLSTCVIANLAFWFISIGTSLRLPVKVINRFFFLTCSTDFRGFEKGQLNKVVYFKHGYITFLLFRLYGLACGGVATALTSEQISSSIPQSRPTSKFTPPMEKIYHEQATMVAYMGIAQNREMPVRFLQVEEEDGSEGEARNLDTKRTGLVNQGAAPSGMTPRDVYKAFIERYT